MTTQQMMTVLRGNVVKKHKGVEVRLQRQRRGCQISKLRDNYVLPKFRIILKYMQAS